MDQTIFFYPGTAALEKARKAVLIKIKSAKTTIETLTQRIKEKPTIEKQIEEIKKLPTIPGTSTLIHTDTRDLEKALTRIRAAERTIETKLKVLEQLELKLAWIEDAIEKVKGLSPEEKERLVRPELGVDIRVILPPKPKKKRHKKKRRESGEV